MTSARAAVWAAILFTTWGCRSEPPPAAPANPPAEPAPPASAALPAPGPKSMADMMCPMVVNGTVVSYSDTADGIQIKFTTNATGNIQELRARVNRMAILHGTRAAGGRAAGGGVESLGSGAETMPEGAGMPPMHGQAHGTPVGAPVPSVATVRELPNGAALTLVPRDPTQVSSLREHARTHAIQMQQTGQCPRSQQVPAIQQSEPEQNP